MKTVVMDTNVAVVTNGNSEQACSTCVETCTEKIEQIMEGDLRLVLDDDWKILTEYINNLQSNSMDLGNAFLNWILKRKEQQCDFVRITSIDGLEHEFNEFPDDPELKDFDPADRKFIAVACAHSDIPPILQAVDSKWWHYKDALDRNGVIVDFICEDNILSILNSED